MEIPVEEIKENVIKKERIIENPVYVDKIETVERVREVPVDKVVEVPVVREVAVEREVVIDKVSEILVRDPKYVEMPISVEVPIHSTKWEEIKIFVDRIIR